MVIRLAAMMATPGSTRVHIIPGVPLSWEYLLAGIKGTGEEESGLTENIRRVGEVEDVFKADKGC